MAVVATELQQQIRATEKIATDVDESMRVVVDAVKRIAEAEEQTDTASDPERTKAVIERFQDTVRSLARTESRLHGHKRAFTKLVTELSAEQAQEDTGGADELRKRVKKAVSDEASAAVTNGGDFTSHSRMIELSRARNGGSAAEAEDEDEDVTCTQAPFDPLCPITKQEFVKPMSVKPCIEQGGTRCVFSKAGIENMIKAAPGRSIKCPQVGCAYTGPITLKDLNPCKETERKIKRLLQVRERERLQRDKDAANLEEDDAIDGEEGVTQVD